ncbi:hypothetical protein XELAEV_18006331mg [Xenopus laevis]|uniref:Uncharacterized protein n=1 Tax=Xenopus laevis TaxID=8355 RepID=A0A974DZD8_XENLA|nr:hypothetical protein XELAEV_18006331mg [Xenopus laevis]
MSDAKLWSYLYNQCMESNIQIDEGMSFSKLKHKISNVMLMVKTFNMLMCSSDRDTEDITKSEILKEEKCYLVNSEILTDTDLVYSETNQVTQVSVITKRQRQSQIMLDINDPELDYQTAKLKLEIDKHLLKIAKTFPKFDKCRTLIGSSHTFEANCYKFDLSEEQRNILFKRWLPVSLATMFEKAYRLVMELNDVDQPTPQSMINELVKKCTFLHHQLFVHQVITPSKKQ